VETVVHKQEDGVEQQERGGDKVGVPLVIHPSSVRFFPSTTNLDSISLPLSQSLFSARSRNDYLPRSQISGVKISTIGSVTSKGTMRFCGRYKNKFLKASSLLGMKKQSLLSLGSESTMIGEGEDYFLSLFGNSKKLTAYPSRSRTSYRHFSMILEEVGQSTSSSLGDIKIAEVHIKGLFVKLINSSLDKEVGIGNYILQQNVNGQRVSLYQFLPNITMQANTTVTVWAATSEAKHEPPSHFLWKEQDKFITSPDCTTILCKPNGQAVAWYVPIHWKQAWEKLETDIEFDRCSVVSPTFRGHMFHWIRSTGVPTKTQDQAKKHTLKCHLEQYNDFIKR
uniref:LTD domain-containing protein n=1 Tax=Otolemur garnettii TaxID=30611 RepID=H0XM77_OTOGA